MARRVEARSLDRGGALPLWAQLEADLLRRMGEGGFDDRFPGEHELVTEYGVSRHTVRDALRRLRDDGILESGRGRGTRVRRVPGEPPGVLHSLLRSVEAMGLEQRTVVRVADARVDDAVAARLGRPAATELAYVERLHLAAGKPLALDRTWAPRSPAEPARPTRGCEVITAVVPDAVHRRLLRIPARTAALAVRRIGLLGDRPVEWREILIRGDRVGVTGRWSAQEGYRMDVDAGTS
jgi:GntR family transcriptional regulator